MGRWPIFVNKIFEFELEKGENAGDHFLRFPHCFQKITFLESIKLGIVWK